MKLPYKQVRLDDWSDFIIYPKEYSRYIQTTWKLSSQVPLELPRLLTRVRIYPEEEAQDLAEIMQKRNVFTRHSYESSFYVSRSKELGNRTVIEIFRKGDPDEIIAESQGVAEITEKIALLSSTLATKRDRFQNLLGIKPRLGGEFNIMVGRDYRYVRSKCERVPEVRGVSINERFCRRFLRCGFPELTHFCLCSNKLADRVTSAIDWLIESRQEPSLPAALIKTSVALESLLIFDKSEPLAKSLSERIAFILSSEANIREQLSHVVKKFYNERSRVVHGSKIRVSPQLVEVVDRLAILLCLVIANNSEKWRTGNGLQQWCEAKRWGKETFDICFPFPSSYLKNAVELSSKC